MKSATALRRLAAAALFATALPVHAQQCDIFTDVQATDIFCNSVQWMRNRAITLGCTATQYCPNDNVTRAQMALFMHRLGRAISPLYHGATASFAAPAPVNPGQFVPVCISGDLAPAGYHRLARLSGQVSVPASGSSAMTMFLVYDNAPPGPWINANGAVATVPTPSGQQNLGWLSNPISLLPNVTHRFAIGIANPVGATGTLTFGAGTCILDVTIINDNPTVPPFDQ